MRYDDQENAMDGYSVRLTPLQARLARRIDDGKLSEGIRKAIEKAYESIAKDRKNNDHH